MSDYPLFGELEGKPCPGCGLVLQYNSLFDNTATLDASNYDKIMTVKCRRCKKGVFTYTFAESQKRLKEEAEKREAVLLAANLPVTIADELDAITTALDDGPVALAPVKKQYDLLGRLNLVFGASIIVLAGWLFSK